MNRTKIEEKLKVAEKEYSSVMFLSDSKSFMKMKIAQAKIQLLTSILAEDGGEVKGWTNVMSGLPKADGRYLIYYEYRKRPEIRKYFIADYSVTDGWLSTLNDIYIIGWKEIEEFNTTPSQHTKGEGV